MGAWKWWWAPHRQPRDLAGHDDGRGVALAPGAGPRHHAQRDVGDWRKNGLKMVAIGLGAAAVGFLIGRLFHATGA